MTLPGITEAAEQGDWPRAAAQLVARGGRHRAATRRSLEGAAADAAVTAPAGHAGVAAAGRCATASTAAWPSTWRTSRTGERVAIDADSSYETFSVIKVPLMATVLERVRRGPAVALGPHHAVGRSAAHPFGRALRARSRARADGEGPAHADDHHQRQRGHRRAGRSRGPRRGHAPSWRRLGLPNTMLRFSDLDWDRRWLSQLDPAYRDGAAAIAPCEFPVREVRRRRGGRGVSPRHRGHRPLLRPEHGARDWAGCSR